MGLRCKEAFLLLVYFGSDRGQRQVATLAKFLSSAIAAGISEYITGQPCPYLHKNFEDSDAYRFHLNKYIDQVWRPNSKISIEQIALLKPLVYSVVEIDGAGDRSSVNLCDTFQPYMHFGRRSADYMHRDDILLAKAIIAGCSVEEISFYESIGRIVQKYIAEDVIYVEQKYSW